MTNNTASSTSDRVSIEIEWADWENALPRTGSVAELSKAIEEQFISLVEEGAYPEGARFERYVDGGRIGSFGPALIEISTPDQDTLIDFYIAYCGGDREQAFAELEALIG